MNEGLVRELIQRSRPDLLTDRCLIIALAIQEVFGGDLVMYANNGGAAHFVNSILGETYDFACDHEFAVGPEVLESPGFLHRVPRVASQLALFRSRFREKLLQRVSIREMQHIIIQDAEHNQGSYAQPDFSCLLLLGSREHRLDAALFAPGQTLWLKYASGPIVARGKLVRWIAASRRNWTDRDIRGICSDSTLGNDRSTWLRLANSSAGYFLLLECEEAEALDVPIHPAEHAYGRTIVTLTTPAQQIAWLHSDFSDFQLPADSSTKPVKFYPFYRFRWEDELDMEVSDAIDDRMPRSGGFFDRVRVVNQALREYFALLEIETAVHTVLHEDELTFLAEIVEEAQVDGRMSQRELVEHIRSSGVALALKRAIDGANLLHLATYVGSLRPTEYAALIDVVNMLIPRLEPLTGETRRRRTMPLPADTERSQHAAQDDDDDY
jgi:hypothetical protein